MLLVPYQQNIEATDTLTETELIIIIAVMYLASFCFVCELALALTNTWKFLIK